MWIFKVEFKFVRLIADIFKNNLTVLTVKKYTFKKNCIKINEIKNTTNISYMFRILEKNNIFLIKILLFIYKFKIKSPGRRTYTVLHFTIKDFS